MADMGFEDMEESPASEDEVPFAEEGQPEAQTTITIPAAMLGGREPKEGDTLTVKVVAIGDDGVDVAISEAPEASGDGYEEAGPQIDQMAAQGDGY